MVLVASKGKIDYLSEIGLSNQETKTKITVKSKFKIASITKTFTAILILQLYEQGKLDLNATFGTYFPNYKGEAKNQVTIKHLLTFSSGIQNSVENLWMEPYKSPLSIDLFIDRYCSGELTFTPGSKSSYSNTEYTILHKIIENVSQKSFEQLLHENILYPLEMYHTNMLISNENIEGLTNSYMIDDATNQLIPDESYFIENYFGSGAMYSTAEDLLKFNNGIFNHQLLKESTMNLVWQTDQQLEGATLGGFWYSGGYGIFNQPFMYRTGGLLGFCSNWIHSIDDQKTIIVLNNTNATNLYEFSEQLYLITKGQKSTLPLNK